MIKLTETEIDRLRRIKICSTTGRKPGVSPIDAALQTRGYVQTDSGRACLTEAAESVLELLEWRSPRDSHIGDEFEGRNG